MNLTMLKLLATMAKPKKKLTAAQRAARKQRQ